MILTFLTILTFAGACSDHAAESTDLLPARVKEGADEERRGIKRIWVYRASAVDPAPGKRCSDAQNIGLLKTLSEIGR